MVRLRQAEYCNLKLFLMFLVVFGHLIEPSGHWLYRLIYTFHMPAFAMLSGLFSHKNPISVANKMLLWYIMLQAVAVFLGKTKILTPYWHLWYLLSNACWLVMGYACERFDKRLVFFAALFAGCVIGYVPQIGRTLSLSRTVVFFPYFLCGRHFVKAWKNSKITACICLTACVAGLIFVKCPTDFFYHAMPYGQLHHGGLLRLACYGIGFGFCRFLFAFSPKRRFGFTKMGTDTLSVYLFHAPIVLFLRLWNLNLLTCAILSIVIIWGFYKLQQGRRYFCGIVQERGRPWPRFKKSTNNTPETFTDSCAV